MSLYLLDTDIVSLFGRQNPMVMGRVAAARQEHEVAVTAITVDESYAGWHTRIRKAREPAEIAEAFAGLAAAAALFGSFSIIPFPNPGNSKVRGTQETQAQYRTERLADRGHCIEAGGIVVTRNLRDFRRVPGLMCEDWSA